MDRHLLFGTIGCFAGTFFSMLLTKYNTNPILLVLLPMWGLVFGVSFARVIDVKKR